MNFWKYLWNSNTTRWQMVLCGIFVVTFTAVVVNGRSHSLGYTQIWQNWLDPMLALGTIIIAVFIWYNEKKQDWENSLPKKLNAFFVYRDQVFYEVKNAPLTGADDVRQWGQQLGRQMNGGDLFFKGFNVRGPIRDTDTVGNYVLRYHLTVWLQTLSEGRSRAKWIYGDDGKVISEEFLEHQ